MQGFAAQTMGKLLWAVVFTKVLINFVNVSRYKHLLLKRPTKTVPMLREMIRPEIFFRYRYLVWREIIRPEIFFQTQVSSGGFFSRPLTFFIVGFLKKFALICFFFVLFLQLAQSNNNCFSKEKDPKCFGTEYNGVSVVLIALRFSSEKLMSDNCNPAHHLLICLPN